MWGLAHEAGKYVEDDHDYDLDERKLCMAWSNPPTSVLQVPEPISFSTKIAVSHSPGPLNTENGEPSRKPLTPSANASEPSTKTTTNQVLVEKQSKRGTTCTSSQTTSIT